jgi:hypothetical protein
VVCAFDAFTDAGACCCLVHGVFLRVSLFVLMSLICVLRAASTNETFYYFS